MCVHQCRSAKKYLTGTLVELFFYYKVKLLIRNIGRVNQYSYLFYDLIFVHWKFFEKTEYFHSCVRCSKNFGTI